MELPSLGPGVIVVFWEVVECSVGGRVFFHVVECFMRW